MLGRFSSAVQAVSLPSGSRVIRRRGIGTARHGSNDLVGGQPLRYCTVHGPHPTVLHCMHKQSGVAVYRATLGRGEGKSQAPAGERG